MPFAVIYDACVLYPPSLRDLLLSFVREGIVFAGWSESILSECFCTMQRDRPDIRPETIAHTQESIRKTFPHCLVTGYEPLVSGLILPDSEDRHVLAAAIRFGAQAIVTFNLKDFPKRALDAFEMEAVHPDDFVLSQICLRPGVVAGLMHKQMRRLRNPPMTLAQGVDSLRRCGLEKSAKELRYLVGL